MSTPTWTGFMSNERMSQLYFHTHLHLMMGLLHYIFWAASNKNEVIPLLDLFSYWWESEFFTSFSSQLHAPRYIMSEQTWLNIYFTIQCGSENRMCPFFEWLKVDWISNGPVFQGFCLVFDPVFECLTSDLQNVWYLNVFGIQMLGIVLSCVLICHLAD